MCIFSCAEQQGLTCTSSPKDLQGINWNGSKDLNERVSKHSFRHSNISRTNAWRHHADPLNLEILQGLESFFISFLRRASSSALRC